MDLKAKLNTAKNLSSDTPVSERRVNRSEINTFSESMIDNITEQVFGNKLLDDGSGKKPYDARTEMEMIKEGFSSDNVKKSKLPAAIKEAMVSNPLIITTVDPKMDAFTAKLAAVQGVQKAATIMNQLDEEDAAKENARKSALNENIQHSLVNIDYNMIKTIVENAVKSLKDDLRHELNESMARNNQNDASLKVMKMGNKFLFLDSEDNIFECQMVYKGKNKSKKR